MLKKHIHLITFLLVTGIFISCATSVKNINVEDTQPQQDSLYSGVLSGINIYEREGKRFKKTNDSLDAKSPLDVLGAAQAIVELDTTDYYKVKGRDTTVWVKGGEALTVREYKEKEQLVDQLRTEGKSVIPIFQSFSKNSASGISIGLGVYNFSESATIKYLRFEWQLFNDVGDPVAGNNSGTAVETVQLTGPLNPMSHGSTEFENVWYSNTGTCAELQKMEIEYMSGQTVVVTNLEHIQALSSLELFELKRARTALTLGTDGVISDYASGSDEVLTDGECSYKAQQERQ